MIMPFIRLVIIYIVVILAAVLFFNRDKVMPLLGFGGEKTAAMSTTPAPAPATASAADDTSGQAANAPDDQQAVAAAQAPASTTAEQPAVQPIQQPVAEEPATEQPPKYPTAETAQVATPTAQPAPAPAPAPAPVASDIDTRLKEARQAYWSRDLAGAETRYKKLAQDFPDNADIKGELGNLYYAQRRNAEAAEMYYQAGLLLINQGNPQQVMLLIGVLQAIAPEKAADLRQRLSQ